MLEAEHIQHISDILQEILQQLGMESTIKHEISVSGGDVFNVSSPESPLLIGRQGVNLYALQVLSQAIAAKRLGVERFSFTLDIDDYRLKRDWQLKQIARAAAEQAKFSGKITHLENMPSFERRIVHEFLQEKFPEVTSVSEGTGHYRHIVVKPAEQSAPPLSTSLSQAELDVEN